MKSYLKELEKIKKYSNPKLKSKIRAIIILITMVLILISLVTTWTYELHKEEMTEKILLAGFCGILIASAFLDFIPQILSPYMILAMSIAVGLNFYISVWVIIIGSLIGSYLGFEMGRFYGPKIISVIIDDKHLVKVLKFWEKGGKWVVLSSITLHIPPWLPTVFGCLGLKRSEFWLYGMLPRAITFFIVGWMFDFGISHLGFI